MLHLGRAPCSTLGQLLNISFLHFSEIPHLPGLFERRSSTSKGLRYWRKALDRLRVSEEVNHSGETQIWNVRESRASNTTAKNKRWSRSLR